MSHTLVLQVPENLYEAIRSQAARQGQTPDKLVAQWLDETIRRIQSTDRDPLVELFGTIRSDVSDIAERHDHYIGQALIRELHDGQ